MVAGLSRSRWLLESIRAWRHTVTGRGSVATTGRVWLRRGCTAMALAYFRPCLGRAGQFASWPERRDGGPVRPERGPFRRVRLGAELPGELGPGRPERAGINESASCRQQFGSYDQLANFLVCCYQECSPGPSWFKCPYSLVQMTPSNRFPKLSDTARSFATKRSGRAGTRLQSSEGIATNGSRIDRSSLWDIPAAGPEMFKIVARGLYKRGDKGYCISV